MSQNENNLEPDSGGRNPVTRRRFVGSLGAAAVVGGAVTAGGATLAARRLAAASEEASRPPDPTGGSPKQAPRTRRLSMILDLDRCIGCQACSVACKAEHGIRLGGFRAWVSEKEVGCYPTVSRLFLPRLCNHCEHPPCLDVCPTGATYKRDDGLVAIDKSRCIGCRHCMKACPYGVRYFNPSRSADEKAFPALTHGTVDKCDFCSHRIDRGVVPACVNTCPVGARIFGDLNDPEGQIQRLKAEGVVQPLLPEFGTGPSVFYKGGRPEVFKES